MFLGMAQVGSKTTGNGPALNCIDRALDYGTWCNFYPPGTWPIKQIINKLDDVIASVQRFLLLSRAILLFSLAINWRSDPICSSKELEEIENWKWPCWNVPFQYWLFWREQNSSIDQIIDEGQL